ncbi:hypothetical protein DLAC_09627 [Tieghemostelium lacteum]|uniref:Calcium uniporter protein n=1 Tax=Tieghemostelium lacteum TaxID=361077 RepID=A0A151Z6S7_TIELA|nr:hypothetical protein DLAC_09627 [Tieghemostelium lacteum]|eukprot:KYQ89662.1 hypothetical protein DLAC_09627 [Tieghemostelium lacteum]
MKKYQSFIFNPILSRGVLNSSFRCYTTSTIALGKQEIDTILRQSKAVKLQERLDLDPRHKITFDEFKQICAEFEIQDKDVKSLSQALSDTGKIVYLPDSIVASLKSSIFIKPNIIYQSLYNILDIENKGVGLSQLIEIKRGEIDRLKSKLAPLQVKKDVIDKKASRRAHTIIYTGLGYCFVQAAILGRLTWWDLSWDIIEPVSYFLTFGSVLFGYCYFSFTKTEFTYEALTHRLFSKKQAKLFKRTDFPILEYTRLSEMLATKEKELEALETTINYSSNIAFETLSQKK